MRKRIIGTMLPALLAAGLLAGCGGSGNSGTDVSSAKAENTAEPEQEKTEVIVFAAKSLNRVLDDLIALYQEDHPDVSFVTNYDSSGTLMTQIDEGGASCDVFFSAAQSQMNTLETEGFVAEGSRRNVVNNQVCVVTYKGSPTAVTGLQDLDRAESLAMAGGTVPVGRYTRQALINMGVFPDTADPAAITAEEISDALGGVTVNECANVGAVASAVAEQSNEVGTVYYSDTFGYEDRLEILEIVSYDLTGNVIYPAAGIVNAEASDAEKEAAVEFLDFLVSDAAKAVFEEYHFDTDV